MDPSDSKPSKSVSFKVEEESFDPAPADTVIPDESSVMSEAAAPETGPIVPETGPETAVPPETEAKAKEFLKNIGATESDREGLQDLQNLSLSMGLPTARACFRAMLAANASPATSHKYYKEAMRQIANFSPVTEIGCMRVDFFNTSTNRADVAYMVLDECAADHDLGAQIVKLRTHVADEKWPEVVKHMSMLIHLGRSIYSQIAEKEKPLIRKIFSRPAAHDCADLLKLGVDSRNTTLFVDPRWPQRVGIFIRLASELGE